MKKKKKDKKQKQKRVKLLKFVRDQWKVVDYGLPSKAHVYAGMGYIVQWE